MKNSRLAVIVPASLGMAMASGVALSECPPGLDAEMLVECITVEGSGADYQDWRTRYEQALRSTAKQPVQRGRNLTSKERLASNRSLTE